TGRGIVPWGGRPFEVGHADGDLRRQGSGDERPGVAVGVLPRASSGRTPWRLDHLDGPARDGCPAGGEGRPCARLASAYGAVWRPGVDPPELDPALCRRDGPPRRRP